MRPSRIVRALSSKALPTLLASLTLLFGVLAPTGASAASMYSNARAFGKTAFEAEIPTSDVGSGGQCYAVPDGAWENWVVDEKPPSSIGEFTDPDGRLVRNTSPEPVVIKPETGQPVYLRPGETYPNEVDGVMPPAHGGDWLKVSNRTDVVILPDGTYETSGAGSFVPTSTETEGVRGKLPGIKNYEEFTRNREDWKLQPETPPALPGAQQRDDSKRPASPAAPSQKSGAANAPSQQSNSPSNSTGQTGRPQTNRSPSSKAPVTPPPPPPSPRSEDAK